MPELAPWNKNRFLGTTSLVTSISYKPEAINYSTYDSASDMLRLTKKPGRITCDGAKMKETADVNSEGFSWKALPTGGVLKIKHTGKKINIFL